MNVSEAQWRRSSYSGPEQGNCVEWAPEYTAAHGVVPVRDSKATSGPVLTFEPNAFADFVSAVRQDKI